MKKTLFFFIIYLLTFQLSAQWAKAILKNNQYRIGAGAFVSSDSTLPFFLQANQYGEVPYESQFLQFRSSFLHEYDSLFNKSGKLKKFNWGYGANLVANVGKVNQLILSEAYVKARLGAFEVYGGRRKEIFGLVDTTMTSGSYIWSGNALPLPKLQISIPNYAPILKNGLISIKGGFAHGWFDNRRLYTRDLKLHQKWFYAKLGKPSWKMAFYGGFNHQVQWGGYSPFFTVDGKLPDGFRNYLHVVMGTRGAITGVPETLDFDANRIGNHLGSIDFGLELASHAGKWFLYRQSFYDDGSLFYLNNISDGLLGLSFEIRRLRSFSFIPKKILFEFFDSSNQGGRAFLLIKDPKNPEPIPNELRGSDHYFNNAQIRDGWVNNNRTLGTPFIQIPNELNRLGNNRVGYYHFQSNWKLKTSLISLRYIILNNWGTYTQPLEQRQQMFSLKFNFPLKESFVELETNYQNGGNLGTKLYFKKRL